MLWSKTRTLSRTSGLAPSINTLGWSCWLSTDTYAYELGMATPSVKIDIRHRRPTLNAGKPSILCRDNHRIYSRGTVAFRREGNATFLVFLVFAFCLPNCSAVCTLLMGQQR